MGLHPPRLVIVGATGATTRRVGVRTLPPAPTAALRQASPFVRPRNIRDKRIHSWPLNVFQHPV